MAPGSEDDQGPHPHPGPSDRPWFHPSELPLEAPPPRARRRRVGLPLVTALASAGVAAALVGLVFGSGSSPEPAGSGRVARSGAGPTFVLPVEHGRSAVQVPVVEVLAWDGPGVTYGSGVVYGGDGIVVTAASVVGGASTVEVRHGGDRVDARLVGVDADHDLAVLEVPVRLAGASFAAATDEVGKGEVCFVVASTSRERQIALLAGAVVRTDVVQANAGRWLVGAIEFEAPTGSAAAGGALVDRNGRLAGIVTSVRSEHGGRPLAVPAATVVRSVEALLDDGTVEHSWLGVAARDEEGLAGPRVVAVAGDGPAAESGLVAGDVVLTIGGAPVPDVDALMLTVHELAVGSPVVVRILRDGAEVDVPVTVGARRAS